MERRKGGERIEREKDGEEGRMGMIGKDREG